jgi:streptogramin lyase
MAALAGALALPASAGAQGITEFPVPAGSGPAYLTTGHDGRVWFTANAKGEIGRISPGGVVQPSIPSAPGPIDIMAGPQGAMYWATPAEVQRRTAAGTVNSFASNSLVTGYAIASAAERILWTQIYRFSGGGSYHYNSALAYKNADSTFEATYGLISGGATEPILTDVSVAPDGKLWFAAYHSSNILRTTASGGLELKQDLASYSYPWRITPGPDGAMWFTEFLGNKIGRITNAGVVTEFDLPRPDVGPSDIVAGPDGALWFTEYLDTGNAIGRITTDGKVTEYPIPTPKARAWGIATGPDGNIWFAENVADKIGRLDPSKVEPLGGGGGGGPGADKTKPAFQGKVTLSRKRFSVGRASTPFTVARAVPSGTQLRFNLSEPARVTVKIERRASGRRVRGRCRTGARSGKRCKTWKSAGRSLTRQGLQGPNSIAFSGRLGRKALAKGSYRALITATDAAGNRSKTVTLSFAIVAKRR